MKMTMGIALAAMVGLTGSPALADMTAKDVQVIAKTLGFTVPPLTGAVKVAVVFDPASPASQKDADDLKGILGSGLAVGAATLSPVLVPIAQLDAGLNGTGLVLVTSGLSAQQERVFAAAKAKKLISVSPDAACVRSGHCVMGIKSEPKVEIVINKSAADASSVSFAPAFRMMISEI
ncbi:hypothetical protein AZL_028170 [Azospirillum sp. B510]|uniref:hypothetical protein n=1 Tax=Azospirillum sp. (strain B510) TaxID=137722 RepID=UPI0001C4C82C|nr:hypothetical protein [Azospirillum sp. B510]BAI73455.1 hypothetical protein AZL_028170 [Azospirillum sp. B510]